MFCGRPCFIILSRRLVLVVSDGTVTTSTVTAESTSGVDEPLGEDVFILVTLVNEEEQEGEADLGGTGTSATLSVQSSADSHIEDTVSNDLSVDGDLVDTLRQGPDNGVGGP